ncbi:MAG: metallophosphoesterase family protein [Polyangiales bacterium]|nr:hypothetical protein [Myxococcales bacterium]MCA9578955.1 hypothetical protein [Myxococcales bacterium]MCB9661519.1 metallophosphoesterase [Sandaracinaceae bacterium]
MNTFFTSDTHFGHKRICELAGRPFANVKAMDEALVRNWNATVGADDQVFHLGDFSFHGADATRALLARLNGHVRLVTGNHDRHMSAHTLGLFERVDALTTVKIGERKVVLCHFPIESWDGMHKGALHFHGHSHGSLGRLLRGRLDVGVDCHDYRPIEASEAIRIALSRGDATPVDHHGRRD